MRLAALANGYTPLPVTAPDFQHKKVHSPGKMPFFKDWQEISRETLTPEHIQAWPRTIRNHPNTGLLTGEMVGVDIDVPVPDLAAQIDQLAEAILGPTPLHRIGKAPKLLLCYRAERPLSKMETAELFLADGVTVQVEIMGKGQQVLAYGVHPATMKPYEWPHGAPHTVPLAELPIASETALRAFLAAAEAVLRQAGGRTKREIEKAATAATEAEERATKPGGPSGGASASAPRSGAGGANFFKLVNRRALADVGRWIKAIFPAATKEDGTGAWRVTSADLGRDLQEDLSVHPTEGGHDFGTRKSCSPIDICINHAGAPSPQQAAFWLCDQLGVAPADLGWKEGKKAKQPDTSNAQPDIDENGAIVGLNGFSLTEDGIALAFTAAHQDQLRYDHTRGAWYQWTGKAWRQDETKLAFSWSRRICRQIASRSDIEAKTFVTLCKAATAAAVERFAQSDPALAVTSAIWDRDTFMLGTPGGTVDLHTGEMRNPAPEDFITKLTSVAPAPTPDCPLWLAFLHDATAGDQGLIRFLRQWCGYCLTGDTREHALLFAHGPGGNGKGVLLNTVSRIMGDYARTASMETFTAAATDRHPTDLAMLRGARLVTASETEEGRAWAESRIKQMTGGDPIAARFMRQDFFEFVPQFKLTIIGNHKPVLRNVDDAARRRFNMAPFLFKPAVVDRELEQKLKAEWPAILRWMIEGCLDWLKNGLVRPAVVMDATAEYFSEQDTVQQWIAECCILSPTQSDTMAALFKSWSDYALANGEKPGTTKWFSQTLARQGCEAVKSVIGERGKRGFKGICVIRKAAPSPHEPGRQEPEAP
jgi:P4 family phage/plasmid primase-like protien